MDLHGALVWFFSLYAYSISILYSLSKGESSDSVFCLGGKGKEESIFMGVSLGSFKRYQLSKVCIRCLIQE